MEYEAGSGGSRLRVLIRGLTRDAEPTVTGLVELRDGRAVPDGRARTFLESFTVVEPGNSSRSLTFDDGIEYLLALPYNLAGTYAWAEIEGYDLSGVPYRDALKAFEASPS